MQVRVKLFATLTRSTPGVIAGVPFDVELPAGATLDDLIEQLKLPRGEVRTIFVNGRAQELTHVLRPGDELGIFPAIGGG